MTDVIIPARDEAGTIAAVVDACLGSLNVGNVIVVANGCDDDTANVAADAGALVLEQDIANKGSAIIGGLGLVQSEHVLFCDADLLGLDAAHIDGMVTLPPFDGQLCGVVDTPASSMTRWLPPITGQRRLPTAFARKVAGLLDGAGYEMELRIDAAVGRARLPHKVVVLRGVTNPSRVVTNPTRFLAMVGGVAMTSAYLLPELIAYERGAV